MTRISAAVLLFWIASASHAEIKSKTVTYTHNGVSFKGHLAWDDAAKERRPGILVVHEWWGLNDYARKRAEQLAKLGYVGFACDMYGGGKTTEHPKEASAMAGEVRKNLKDWQGRALAALKILQDNPSVYRTKLAAIGYCFGGSTALQLTDQAKAIKAKILICHGALDSFIPEDTIKKVRAAYDDHKIDYQMIYYGGAVHSFTVPEADKAGVKGLAYHPAADRRSWSDMQQLFSEVFAPRK